MTQQYAVEQLNYGHKVYDFMYYNHFVFIISSIFLILSLVVMGIRGFNWGLDFTGGTVIEIHLEKPTNLQLIRNLLEKGDFIDPLIQNFGSSRDIMVRISPNLDVSGQELSNKVLSIINQGTAQNAMVQRIEFVGPSVGNDLAQDGAMALLSALICILIYIAIRFEWRLALGSVLALVHDVIITMGVLSFLKIEINLTIVASLMSVIGYSLNDSIVISDRIRENFCKIHRGTPYEIINVSLTQTLNRTLITSGTILGVVLILYSLGGFMLKGFSVAMLIGVSIGTISSIYVASSLALKLGIERKHFVVKKIRKQGE